jgi:UDP-N-acetylmuramoyl-L-alanyl-D-glutamate--2,6-diaminopimelate ligase
MMLKEILDGCDYPDSLGNIVSFQDMDIAGIAYDSREVKEGYLFTAIKGEKFNGNDFIHDVLERGAVAIIYERAGTVTYRPDRDPHAGVCFIPVENSRRALACVANNFYRRPSEKIALTGITGTNGKTTTSYILKSILERGGRHVGLIGTIHYILKDSIHPAVHTTPESPQFQSLLHEMVLSGCDIVVSEVSSHALAQYRVDNAVFRTAVFTNLTRDHLDYHKTMEQYFRAKERLFTDLLHKDGSAVINIDDPHGKRLASLLRGRSNRTITYSLDAYAGSDMTASRITSTFKGVRFSLSFEGRNYSISSPLLGTPNVYNILSAVGAAVSLNVPFEAILDGINNTNYIPGRFERISAGQKFLCIVDYAHTEDALARLIKTAREIISSRAAGKERGEGLALTVEKHPPARVITVFGCGGDRDRGKRPGMGAVATRLSDFVIITSDNPRSEEPLDIIRDIESGVAGRNYLVEPDRREAIGKAVDMAGAGDIVLVAGKGHESCQEIKGIRHKFSDRDVLEELIRRRLTGHSDQ